MWRLLSSTAIALAMATPVWAQTSGYGEPARTMNIQVCSQASGTPECRGVADWGVAAELGLSDVSEAQPGSIAGEDAEVDEWQPDAGRGTTGSGPDNRAGSVGGIGDGGTGGTDTGDAGTGDTDTGDTGTEGGETGDNTDGDVEGGTS